MAVRGPCTWTAAARLGGWGLGETVPRLRGSGQRAARKGPRSTGADETTRASRIPPARALPRADGLPPILKHAAEASSVPERGEAAQEPGDRPTDCRPRPAASFTKALKPVLPHWPTHFWWMLNSLFLYLKVSLFPENKCLELPHSLQVSLGLLACRVCCHTSQGTGAICIATLDGCDSQSWLSYFIWRTHVCT